MATLADTIKGTSGLLAYWPLTDNQDQSGNGRHLTIVGSPAFNQASLNKDGRRSVVTPANGGTLQIDQSTLPKIKAVEGWFRFAGPKTGAYSVIVGLNQPLTGNANRAGFSYVNSQGVQTWETIGSTTEPKSNTYTWDYLSAGGHHFVMQLNAAGTQTEIYIDGGKDPAMTLPEDVFLRGAGQHLTVGALYYNAEITGNGQCADFAIYDRPLTQQEITDRATYLIGGINDQALRDVILASNPVGYYPLDNQANLGNDISPYANHGSQSGSFTPTMATLFGMTIKLIRGTSSPLVAIPDRAEYRGRTLTMECLIILNEDTNTVIMERGGDNKNWSLQTIGTGDGSPANSVQNVLGDQSISDLNGRGGPLPTTVCHLIATSVNGVTKLYVNGEVLKEWTVATGNGIQANQGTLPIHLFSRGGLYNSAAYLAHVAFYNRELTPAERTARYNLLYGSMQWANQPITTIPANQETRAQFQPQDIAWRGGPGFVYPGPMPAPPARAKPLCQGQDMNWVRDGVQNVAQGYIESTVTISGEGVRRRVLCFDQAGNLVGETMSRASDGKYRFDLLWLNRRYMLVAQDDPAFGPADYNAVAADYQQPTPYAPGQGVGLV